MDDIFRNRPKGTDVSHWLNWRMPLGGPIRFDGGPWHSRVVNVRQFTTVFCVLNYPPSEELASVIVDESVKPCLKKYKVTEYDLSVRATSFGTIFLEYSVRKETTDDA